MENQSRTSKFVSRQTVKLIEQARKTRILLVVGAALGILSMVFALTAVHKRVNPQIKSNKAESSHSVSHAKAQTLEDGDFVYTRNGNTLTLTAYNGTDNVLEVPASVNGMAVTSIGANALSGNSYISSVTLPDSVSSIGASAFKGCSRLIHVDMSESLITVGEQAFLNCKMLKSITLPESFLSAHLNSFRGCADDFTLSVYEGSVAQQFAEQQGYSYNFVQEESEAEDPDM